MKLKIEQIECAETYPHVIVTGTLKCESRDDIPTCGSELTVGGNSKEDESNFKKFVTSVDLLKRVVMGNPMDRHTLDREIDAFLRGL